MAIDRNIIKWSLENKAFEAKSYIEIFNMLLANYRAIYGNEIDLSVETAFGEELRMNTELFVEFANLAQDIYYTLDINNAKGAILDNLVAFTSNITRKTNLQTILKAQITFEGDIPGYDPKTSGVYVQDNQGISWKVELGEDIPVSGEGVLKAGAYESTLTCVSYGENIISDLVMMSVNSRFHTGVVSTTDIIYEQIGSIEETDEMLRMRKNNILNYNSVGVLDSIRDYILKNIISVKDVKIYNANGRSTAESSKDSPGNSIIELRMGSDGEVVNEVGIPKHDVFVIIQPQEGLSLDTFAKDTESTGEGGKYTTRVISRTSKAIAEAIKRKMTPGIATSARLYKIENRELVINNPYDIDINKDGTYPTALKGAMDVNYITVKVDVDGTAELEPEEYRFYIARKYSPKIIINLQTRSNYDRDTSRVRIREAIYELSKNYTINKDIDIAEVLTAVMSANIDTMNPSFIPMGIVIIDESDPDGDPTGTAVEVNNGYWLVDKDHIDKKHPDEKTYNIIIKDGGE